MTRRVAGEIRGLEVLERHFLAISRLAAHTTTREVRVTLGARDMPNTEGRGQNPGVSCCPFRILEFGGS